MAAVCPCASCLAWHTRYPHKGGSYWLSALGRRLAFGTCLTLAYKFNEQGTTQTSEKLPLLLDFIDREWYTSNKQILEAEFGVFFHLDFALHCQLYEVSHHFSRLLKMIEIVPKDYLGKDIPESSARRGVPSWRFSDHYHSFLGLT